MSAIILYFQEPEHIHALMTIGIIAIVICVVLPFLLWTIKRIKFKGEVKVGKEGITVSTEEKDKEISGLIEQGKINISVNSNTMSEKELTEIIPKDGSKEHYLFAFLEEKEAEISNLRQQLDQLQKRVQELESDLKRRETEENLKKGLLIPFNQHQIFSNIKSCIDQTINFDHEKSVTKEKAFIVREFLNKVVLSIMYKNLKKFVAYLEGDKNEADVREHIISIQELLFRWNDEQLEMARTLKLYLPNGICIYGVPESFLKKYFEWYDKHFYVVVEKIRGVLFSTFYRTWQMRIAVILDILDLLLMASVEDAKTSMLLINGQFEKDIENKIKSLKEQCDE